MEILTFEIDQEALDQLQPILDRNGLTFEGVLTLFLEACVATNGVPFAHSEEDIRQARENPILRLVSVERESL